MADQKNDDTKTPSARRGARPFGGPASPSAPSRPFVRPATGQRPTAAPFVAPVAAGKLVLRNAAPAPGSKTAAPIAPPLIPAANMNVTPLSTRPVTSEVAALDAVDAFDAVWSVSEQSGRVAEPAPVASPLDEASLGNGIDGQQLWAEDITATDIPAGESDVVPAPIALESGGGVVASTTPAWLEDDVVLAESTAVESKATPVTDDVPPVAVQPLSEVNGGYGFGEWTEAHTIPASDEIIGVPPEEPVPPAIEALGEATPAAADWTAHAVPASAELPPRFELAATNQEPLPEVSQEEEEPQLAVFTAASAETYSPHGARIAAAFDRLADRVRSGEIDVSSIAPEATDAAVLASVLAALLGGSRSR